jgi:programmed cell death 6-interacting protein
MPSLGNLNLSHKHAQAQGHPVANYGSPMPQQGHPGMPRPAVHSPAAASIQSWAGGGEAVQQPQPVQPPANPMGGVWDPSMGIKFASGGSASGAAGGGQSSGSGTWNPASGIKFG